MPPFLVMLAIDRGIPPLLDYGDGPRLVLAGRVRDCRRPEYLANRGFLPCRPDASRLRELRQLCTTLPALSSVHERTSGGWWPG